MNLDLQEQLQACGVTFSSLTKSEKVKTLARWTKEFPEVVQAARHAQRLPTVLHDNAADAQYSNLRNEQYFVIPDDSSGMPTYHCRSEALPELRELVSDSITRCDELIVLASDFRWCMVLVNHGAPQLVARHFQDRTNQRPTN